MKDRDTDAPLAAHPDPGFRALSLLTGVGLALLLGFFPHIAMDRWGGADPLAAGLLLWAMAAGLASGIGGFRPPAAARPLLTSEACLLALVLALLRIAGH